MRYLVVIRTISPESPEWFWTKEIEAETPEKAVELAWNGFEDLSEIENRRVGDYELTVYRTSCGIPFRPLVEWRRA